MPDLVISGNMMSAQVALRALTEKINNVGLLTILTSVRAEASSIFTENGRELLYFASAR